MKPATRAVLIAASVLAALYAVVPEFNGSRHPVRAPRPVQVYTARELFGMFHANEIRADQTIGRAAVRFSGTVTSIEESDFSHVPELEIGGAWGSIDAELKPAELRAAAALAKGQRITLQCDSVSMPVTVYAAGCVIVPAVRP